MPGWKHRVRKTRSSNRNIGDKVATLSGLGGQFLGYAQSPMPHNTRIGDRDPHESRCNNKCKLAKLQDGRLAWLCDDNTDLASKCCQLKRFAKYRQHILTLENEERARWLRDQRHVQCRPYHYNAALRQCAIEQVEEHREWSGTTLRRHIPQIRDTSRYGSAKFRWQYRRGGGLKAFEKFY